MKKYKILMVSNRYDEHVANYSLDYSKIKSLALKEKQLKLIQKWMNEKIESTYINVNRESCVFNTCFLKHQRYFSAVWCKPCIKINHLKLSSICMN